MLDTIQRISNPKNVEHDRHVPSHTGPMNAVMSASERIRWILENCVDPQSDPPKRWSSRALSLRAGLTHNHLHWLTHRLAEEPGKVHVSTLEALAVAAGVSKAWLAFGEGTPLPVGSNPAVMAAMACRASGVPELAIESALEDKRLRETPLSVLDWVDQMRARAKVLYLITSHDQIA